MTDLVARLCEANHINTFSQLRGLAFDAADEIESLRRVVEAAERYLQTTAVLKYARENSSIEEDAFDTAWAENAAAHDALATAIRERAGTHASAHSAGVDSQPTADGKVEAP